MKTQTIIAKHAFPIISAYDFTWTWCWLDGVKIDINRKTQLVCSPEWETGNWFCIALRMGV